MTATRLNRADGHRKGPVMSDARAQVQPSSWLSLTLTKQLVSLGTWRCVQASYVHGLLTPASFQQASDAAGIAAEMEFETSAGILQDQAL